MKRVSVVYLVEKSSSKVMVTLVFSHRGRRGRWWRRCSDGVEEDEAAGMPGMALGVEEEDRATVIDDDASGGAALSAWRKTTASDSSDD